MMDVLEASSDSREQMITNYIMTYPIPTWEFAAGVCFGNEKEKTLEEMKKKFKRKSGEYCMAGNFRGVKFREQSQ